MTKKYSILAFFICVALSSFSQQKDTLYWNHIFNPPRLVFITKDTTISGAVVKVIKEKDGDYHVIVLTKEGPLNVEIICAAPGEKEICNGYNNIIPRPKKGNIVQVKGDYVYDKKHGWYEIHPVKEIKVL